jgi:hypothetical protein
MTARIIPAALAAGLLVTSSALALAASPERSAEIKAFAHMPSSSAANAISAAEHSSRGTVLGIRYELGKDQYRVDLLKRGKLMTANVDPMTESVGPGSPVGRRAARELKPEQAVEKMLKPGSTSLRQAVEMAQQRSGGKAIDAYLVLRQGKPAYEIGVINGTKMHAVYLDPQSNRWLGYGTKRPLKS